MITCLRETIPKMIEGFNRSEAKFKKNYEYVLTELESISSKSIEHIARMIVSYIKVLTILDDIRWKLQYRCTSIYKSVV